MIDTLDLSRCRVLLIDDVKSSLDVLVEVLQGHHLLSLALDGESALRIIAQSQPDLVLLDLMMPGMDGYEVCRRLRADPATRDLPVVFLSALVQRIGSPFRISRRRPISRGRSRRGCREVRRGGREKGFSPSGRRGRPCRESTIGW